jgi:hypothetical protein
LASVALLADLANPAGHHRRQRHRGREPDRRRSLVRGVGQSERAHLPSGLACHDPDLQKNEKPLMIPGLFQFSNMALLAHLAEQVLHVDAGADEGVAEREGDERERDGGGQVRAAVLGQQLLGLVRPRLLLPLAFFFSLLVLGAEYLQQRSATHRVPSDHERGLASENQPLSVSRAYFPEAKFEAVLLGDLFGRLRLALLLLLHGRDRELQPARETKGSGREEATLVLRLWRPVAAVPGCRRGDSGEEHSCCHHGWVEWKEQSETEERGQDRGESGL